MKSTDMRKLALAALEKRGILLVFPLRNKPEPKSVWSELFPRSVMRWEWNESGDNRVGDLWRLREELSRSRKAVYAKWFQGRATLFSRDTFVEMLAYMESAQLAAALPRESRQLLEILNMDSPVSTKQLKAAAELAGRSFESLYTRAMKPLWNQLQIVGFGEFDDSSFPSLGIGSAEVLFEDLWRAQFELSAEEAARRLQSRLGAHHPFWLWAQKVKARAAQ